MDFYRCENPDCGLVAEEEPDVCPRCGGTFFTGVAEEEMTASDWVSLGNQAVDEKRETDALAAYQRAAAMNDPLGLTNLGWCLEAGVGVPADPRQAVMLYAQAAEREYMPALTNLGYCYTYGIGVETDYGKALKCFQRGAEQGFPGPSSCWRRPTAGAAAWRRTRRRPPSGISPPPGWATPAPRRSWAGAWNSARAWSGTWSRR